MLSIVYKTRSRGKNTEIKEVGVYWLKNLCLPAPSPIPAILNKKIDLGPNFKYSEGFQKYALFCLLCPAPLPESLWHPIHEALPAGLCSWHKGPKAQRRSRRNLCMTQLPSHVISHVCLFANLDLNFVPRVHSLSTFSPLPDIVAMDSVLFKTFWVASKRL